MYSEHEQSPCWDNFRNFLQNSRIRPKETRKISKLPLASPLILLSLTSKRQLHLETYSLM